VIGGSTIPGTRERTTCTLPRRPSRFPPTWYDPVRLLDDHKRMPEVHRAHVIAEPLGHRGDRHRLRAVV
jgi:hypothetical protein